MPSVFPTLQNCGNTEATRRHFMRWLEVQEEDFPLLDVDDKSWQTKLRSFIEEYVHPEVVLHGVPVKKPGREGWIEFLISIGNAYPDGQTTYDAIVVDGDLGAALWTYRATHRNTFGSHAQTGKKLEISGTMYDRFEGGRIVEHWAIIDRLSWLKQLGALPPHIDL